MGKGGGPCRRSCLRRALLVPCLGVPSVWLCRLGLTGMWLHPGAAQVVGLQEREAAGRGRVANGASPSGRMTACAA